MSRELSEIPAGLQRELERERPIRLVIPLISLDGQGFPHTALLSFYELLYRPSGLHFYLFSSSRTVRFLRERARCSLIFVSRKFVYYLKGRAVLQGEGSGVTVFRLALDTIREDFPAEAEGAAWLVTGARFGSSPESLAQRQEQRRVVQEWLSRQERTRENGVD